MEKIQNWDNIQETRYIDKEGAYTLKIVDIAKDENGNVTQETPNGKEYHKYLCKTQDGEEINVTLYLVEKALWKYKKFVSACGLETKGQVNFDELPKLLLGKKFIGTVKRQAPKMNVETGLMEESKYFEVAEFNKVEF